MEPSRPVHGQIDFGLWCCFSLKQSSCPPLINYTHPQTSPTSLRLSSSCNICILSVSHHNRNVINMPTRFLTISRQRTALFTHSVLCKVNPAECPFSDRRVHTEARCGSGHVWKLLKAGKHVVTHTLHIILEAKCSMSRPGHWLVYLTLTGLVVPSVCVVSDSSHGKCKRNSRTTESRYIIWKNIHYSYTSYELYLVSKRLNGDLLCCKRLCAKKRAQKPRNMKLHRTAVVSRNDSQSNVISCLVGFLWLKSH